jgi:hypothetical protein
MDEKNELKMMEMGLQVCKNKQAGMSYAQPQAEAVSLNFLSGYVCIFQF